MTNECPKCRTENPDTKSFCGDCGTRLSLHEGVSVSVTKTIIAPTAEGRFVAGDESQIIYSAADRPDGFGEIDLYVSFRKKDGTWTVGQNLGERINSISIDIWSVVSPEGKHLFFTNRRSGNMDIYWADAEMIEALKPEV